MMHWWHCQPEDREESYPSCGDFETNYGAIVSPFVVVKPSKIFERRLKESGHKRLEGRKTLVRCLPFEGVIPEFIYLCVLSL
jgi:hypothetical protein